MNSVRNVTAVALVVAGAVFLSACGDKESTTGKTAREIVEVGVSDAGCSPGVLNLTAGPK
ncbi:MAG: hypothetical protein JJE27_03690, partial [Thermoleophilia bacterium]|nr:hypothetical protein [Thermoleophilia bacterium]